VYLGTIDTSDGSTTRPNDGPYMTIDALEASNNLYMAATESQAESFTGATLSAGNGIQFFADTAQSIAASTSDIDIDGGAFSGYRSRGSLDSPSVIQSGDRLSQLIGYGRHGNGGWSKAGDVYVQSEGLAGTNNEIVTSSVQVRSRNSSDELLSSLICTSNHDVETPNGSLVHNRLDISSSQTTDGHGYYSVDSSGGAVTLTIASADAINGRELNVKRRGANTVTIDTEGSETIDGSSSYTLDVDNESVTLVYNSNFTEWETY
jgi:hypothetical protein